MKSLILGLLTTWLGLSGALLRAQTFDTSGTGSLTGPYFLREVSVVVSDSTTISRSFSVTGVITFDGKGNYSFGGQLLDSGSNSGKPQGYNIMGAYAVSANNLLQMDSLISSEDSVFGAVTPFGITGSMTEGIFNDILVAIPSNGAASTSSISGNYLGASFNFAQGNVANVNQAYFTLVADGKGNFSTFNVNGTALNLGNTLITQTVSGATYSTAGTGGAATFPAPTGANATTPLFSGSKILYVSADGNVLLGGSLNDYDIFIGLRPLSGTASNATFKGTYFTAAIEDDASQAASGQNDVDSYSGSVNGLGNGVGLSDQRLNSILYGIFDYTVNTQFNIGSSGIDTSGAFYYAVGVNGNAAVRLGQQEHCSVSSACYSFEVSFHAPSYSGSGVYLNPIGVVNAASNDPITNPVSPNEIVTLYGTGLAAATVSASSTPLPATLGGVQVTVNGRSAPLLFASPTQINMVVPQATTEAYATFQVTSNGTTSNQVTTYTSPTSPGIFTVSQTGYGQGAITHANGTVVSSKSPAVTGETIIIYLNGMGAVNPRVADGAAAPSNPLSTVVANTGVVINGLDASVSFAGFAPGFVGLFQINAVVPTGAASGQDYVDIYTDDAYHSQATIAVQ